MDKITILDTSIATQNLGDEIIVSAVREELNEVYNNKNTMFLTLPTHEVISRQGRRIINQSSHSFVAGTNLLSSSYSILKANRWNLGIPNILMLQNKAVLVGVGWAKYQGKASTLSRFFYNNVLDKKTLHSVRDEYTKIKLNEAGFDNVINTGCATMWKLTSDHCSTIPSQKASNVVFTLTDYDRDLEKDQKLIDILERNYKRVFFWVQGSLDEEYIHELRTKKVEMISPSCIAFDRLLESSIELDYVGTRLHGGIRALQKGRRSIIIGIDNRAIEKKKDFNLPVVERKDIDKLEEHINSNLKMNIKINEKAILQWKSQF